MFRSCRLAGGSLLVGLAVAVVLTVAAVAVVRIVALNQAIEQIGEAGGMGGVDSGDTAISWTPDGKHIVVARGQEGGQALYELDADGGNPHRLISSTVDADAPAVSLDGRKIAFVDLPRTGGTVTDLYTAETDGSNMSALTHTDDVEGDPSWSPDGRQIAFVRGWELDVDSDLYVMRADGTGVRRLTHGSDVEAAPSWSPDGTSIAYEAYPGVYVIPARGRSPRHLVTTGLAAPTWSPDGKRLAVVEDRATIKVVSLATRKVRRLVVAPRLAQQEVRVAPDDLAWSPDGRRLAYSANGSLYTVDLASGAIERLSHCVDGGDANCAAS
jgi:Tol biopolymer transport system component